MEIELRVNGKTRRIAEGAKLAQLVEELQLDARFLVVEWNGEAVSFGESRERELCAGDRIELVRPVAGG